MARYNSTPTEVLPRAALAAIVTTVIVAALVCGKDILIPIVLAVLLSFVLSPLVNTVLRLKVPLIPTVVLIVTLVVGLIGVLGFALAHQVIQLGDELPKYETTVRQKLKAFRVGATDTNIIAKASEALRELSQEMEQQPHDQSATTPSAPSQRGQPKPIPVEIRQPPNRPLEIYQHIISALLGPMSTTAIVLIMVIFILLQRTDIRDRVIRLAGTSDIKQTTAALNDAATRLSRLFLAQTALNASFGAMIAIGLWIIGVPSPVLWGTFSGLMRFVPYIGAAISAVLPILLGLAVGQGWVMALQTAALFLVMEMIIGNFVEPWMQGQTTGLSPLAIVVSAIFWTTLWGPIGLLIATPITMCLVVLGRHIDGLSFLGVILGDQPALQPDQIFYQRLLSGSPVEISEQAATYLKSGSLLDYYDTVALRGIALAAQDAERGVIETATMNHLRDGVAFVVEDLQDELLEPTHHSDNMETIATGSSDLLAIAPQDLKSIYTSENPAVLCLGARLPIDDAAANILAQLLSRYGVRTSTATISNLSDITRLDLSGIGLVWITATSVSLSHAQVRYIIRRLRRASSDLIICANFCGQTTAHTDYDMSALSHIASDFTSAVRITIECASEIDSASQIAIKNQKADIPSHGASAYSSS